ncbi:DUF4097 family beta strand repeat-containing protein [Pseudonocardia sp. KRD291]|uniref:DUF4097 family beta strand repeat-containing protein n=1 Tax=Pseudonocardia sp. KRD291 TaxID=2792007 RepID=UPI001C4A1527|nr:DUF4097 family beta strand repeat-containing protein [Pseudonocardia sp. KRD291]MBW0103920.1 DUF4097 family beta strand repeat protein [Pseudonocardia sp. KRD291]
MVSSARGRLGVGAVLLATSAALAGCGSPQPAQTESATEGIGAVSRVEIQADTGSVSVRPGPDGSAQVQRTLRWSGETKPEYTQSVSGDTLTITARCPDGDDRCTTDLVVTVPAATSTRTGVTTGDVAVDDLTGAQDLTATTGRVTGTGLGASPVTARATTGQVSLRFAAAPPTVDAEASTGNVDVRVPVGPVYQVQAQVQTGNSRVEVADTPGADHRISARSTTGNVSVTNG